RRALQMVLPQCLSGRTPSVPARCFSRAGSFGGYRTLGRASQPSSRRIGRRGLRQGVYMLTLGINATFHDCSAALVADGQVVAAAEEERFTRIKHGKRPVPFSTWQLPYNAIDFCLSEVQCDLEDVDHIVYAFDPNQLKDDIAPKERIELPLEPSANWKGKGSPWDGLFLSYIVNAPRQLIDGVPLHLQKRFRSDTLSHVVARWQFLEHHLCHEASAFLAAPFEESAVLTMDGRGERTTTSYGHFTSGEYRRLKQILLPHSLGLLYEDLTRYLGFLHSSDEYKVM